MLRSTSRLKSTGNREANMTQAYDLYQEDENGKRIFVETVIGLAQLRALLTNLIALKSGKYLIYDPTRARLVEPFMKFAAANSAAD
jgi:hypothetical protein